MDSSVQDFKGTHSKTNSKLGAIRDVFFFLLYFGKVAGNGPMLPTDSRFSTTRILFGHGYITITDFIRIHGQTLACWFSLFARCLFSSGAPLRIRNVAVAIVVWPHRCLRLRLRLLLYIFAAVWELVGPTP